MSLFFLSREGYILYWSHVSSFSLGQWELAVLPISPWGALCSVIVPCLWSSEVLLKCTLALSYSVGGSSEWVGLYDKSTGDGRMKQDQLAQMPKTILSTERGREDTDSEMKNFSRLEDKKAYKKLPHEHWSVWCGDSGVFRDIKSGLFLQSGMLSSTNKFHSSPWSRSYMLTSK